MKDYRAIIFDLDGVICHTDKYHYSAWKQLADEEGIYFDEEINNRLRGISRMDSLEIILEKSKKKYSKEEKEALADRKNAYYRVLLMNMSVHDLADEVRETLEELDSEYLLAIGSSSKNAKLILKQIGLEDLFDVVSDGIGLVHSKPDPEVFQKAAKRLAVHPYQTLVVEDAIAGIEAAKRGGFDSAAIGDATSSPFATYKLETFSDLLRI